MNSKILFTACMTLLSMSSVQADIYRWVDNEGITHFSDAPPAAGAVQVAAQTVAIQQGYPVSSPDEDYYSIINQSRRLEAQRAEKDALALQKEQLRIEWYRAKQEARVAELNAATRLEEASHPLILITSPYINQPRPLQWMEPRVEVEPPPLMHQMNNLGLRNRQRPVKDEYLQTQALSSGLESHQSAMAD